MKSDLLGIFGNTFFFLYDFFYKEEMKPSEAVTLGGVKFSPLSNIHEEPDFAPECDSAFLDNALEKMRLLENRRAFEISPYGLVGAVVEGNSRSENVDVTENREILYGKMNIVWKAIVWIRGIAQKLCCFEVSLEESRKKYEKFRYRQALYHCMPMRYLDALWLQDDEKNPCNIVGWIKLEDKISKAELVRKIRDRMLRVHPRLFARQTCIFTKHFWIEPRKHTRGRVWKKSERPCLNIPEAEYSEEEYSICRRIEEDLDLGGNFLVSDDPTDDECGDSREMKKCEKIGYSGKCEKIGYSGKCEMSGSDSQINQQMCYIAEDLSTHILSTDRPRWRFLLHRVKDHLYIFFTFHHSLVDGTSLAAAFVNDLCYSSEHPILAGKKRVARSPSTGSFRVADFVCDKKQKYYEKKGEEVPEVGLRERAKSLMKKREKTCAKILHSARDIWAKIIFNIFLLIVCIPGCLRLLGWQDPMQHFGSTLNPPKRIEEKVKGGVFFASNYFTSKLFTFLTYFLPPIVNPPPQAKKRSFLLNKTINILIRAIGQGYPSDANPSSVRKFQIGQEDYAPNSLTGKKLAVLSEPISLQWLQALRERVARNPSILRKWNKLEHKYADKNREQTLCTPKYPSKCEIKYPNKCEIKCPNKCEIKYPNKCEIKYPNKCEIKYPNKCEIKYHDKCGIKYHDKCKIENGHESCNNCHGSSRDECQSENKKMSHGNEKPAENGSNNNVTINDLLLFALSGAYINSLALVANPKSPCEVVHDLRVMMPVSLWEEVPTWLGNCHAPILPRLIFSSQVYRRSLEKNKSLQTESATNTSSKKNSLYTDSPNKEDEVIIEPHSSISQRLKTVKDEMDSMKKRMEVLRSQMVLFLVCIIFPSFIARIVFDFVVRKANIVYTNVIGPKKGARIDGKRVKEIVFFPPSRGGIGWTCAALTYGEQVRISFTADCGALPFDEEVGAAEESDGRIAGNRMYLQKICVALVKELRKLDQFVSE